MNNTTRHTVVEGLVSVGKDLGDILMASLLTGAPNFAILTNNLLLSEYLDNVPNFLHGGSKRLADLLLGMRGP